MFGARENMNQLLMGAQDNPKGFPLKNTEIYHSTHIACLYILRVYECTNNSESLHCASAQPRVTCVSHSSLAFLEWQRQKKPRRQKKQRSRTEHLENSFPSARQAHDGGGHRKCHQSPGVARSCDVADLDSGGQGDMQLYNTRIQRAPEW